MIKLCNRTVDPTWAEKLLAHEDEKFVTKPFEEAIHELTLPVPLYNFLVERYQSVINI